MGKLKITVEIKKADGTTVSQPLLHRGEMKNIDKNREAMFVSMNGDVTIGCTNGILENTGFFRVKNKNKELAEYVSFADLFGWCYTEERV